MTSATSAVVTSSSSVVFMGATMTSRAYQTLTDRCTRTADMGRLARADGENRA
jgi:hypothetical protein